MRRFPLAAVLLLIPAVTVVLDNPHVRVFRTDGSLAGVDHGPGVVISLDGLDNAALDTTSLV